MSVSARTDIYPLSLHDALPICARPRHVADRLQAASAVEDRFDDFRLRDGGNRRSGDRKSTRLNSSHSSISYAVLCLIKKRRTRKASSIRTPYTRMQFSP